MSIDIDPGLLAPLAWFRHATERLDYWQSECHPNPTLPFTPGIAQEMANRWQRERMIAWGNMTQAERDSLRVK